MSITTASRTFQLLSRIFDTKTATEPFLHNIGEKLPLPLRDPQSSLPRAVPEEEGISSAHIRSFLEEMGRGPDLGTQIVMVLRNGKVLASASYGGQVLNAPKYTFSACKSIVSLAVGLLVSDGVLSVEERLEDIFADVTSSLTKRKLKEMTVEDLLTMQAGVLFTEAEAMTEPDWVRSFFASPMPDDPGKEFAYDSLNTYMLAVIIRRKTGKPMLELLKERLFAPMGITDILWETCPAGIEKGGWGLYIRPEDMAKLGQLVMNNGRWNGEQLVSADYIRSAAKAHSFPPPRLGDFNYGYQIWVGRRENTFLFNGMLGQNVLGFRDSGVLLVTNAGMNVDYQDSRYFEIASRYFGGYFPDFLPPNPEEYEKLQAAIQGLSHFHREPLSIGKWAYPFIDRTFIPVQEHAVTTGLLPMVLQALHNNYTDGVTSIAVSIRGSLPELIYREKGAVYRFPVGLGVPEIVRLDFHGDCYLVSVQGRFTHDEDMHPAFVVQMDFLETPCVRILKLILMPDGMLLKQRETPGIPYVYRKLVKASQSAIYKPLLMLAAGGVESDFLMYKTLQLLSPDLRFKSAEPISREQM